VTVSCLFLMAGQSAFHVYIQYLRPTRHALLAVQKCELNVKLQKGDKNSHNNFAHLKK